VKKLFSIGISIIILFFIICIVQVVVHKDKVKIIPVTEYTIDQSIKDNIIQMRINRESNKLVEVYRELKLIDVHYHNAGSPPTAFWNQYGIDKTVLFGDISEPSAINSDNITWSAYKTHPDLIYPSFAGIQLSKDKKGIDTTIKNLEQGYLNIGELVAASTYSPNANNEWKADHPYWGNLPEIYDLAAKYNVPVLLHIDPPNGTPINFFKKALMSHPDTTFIFAHGNVYNSPTSLESLLSKFDNLYIDFFAGFTRYNKTSEHTLEDFVPLIEAYSDRFFISTDSGYDVRLTNAVLAMYELIDKLSAETAAKVAYQNYEGLIETQPPTKQQMKTIQDLASQLNIKNKTYRLNKRQANELIFELEEQVKTKKSNSKKEVDS
jgi:predicted TIM-barrel fold metal-dependent hydrolase